MYKKTSYRNKGGMDEPIGERADNRAQKRTGRQPALKEKIHLVPFK